MSGDVGELFRSIAAVRSLFPLDFEPIRECLKHGISAIRLETGQLFRLPGSYDAEEQTITLDPKVDWSKVAAEINRRHPGLGVTSEDVFVFVFYHEVGHHLQRQRLLGMSRRNGLLARLSFWEAEEISAEEQAAETFAREKHLEWRRTRKKKS